MIEPRLRSVQCTSPSGLHSMAYTEWGAHDNPRAVLCVHGLTRLGRDFDRLARALAPEMRVVCPDVVGRGRSDQLRDPMHYGIPQYVGDMVTLIARLDVDQVDWVGTSMGELIGIGLAGQANSPVRRLVLNDVGPRLDAAALLRIGEYVGVPMTFDEIDHAVDYIATIAKPFGLTRREDWRELVEPGLKRDGDRWTLHYDTRIAAPFKMVTPEKTAADEALLWSLYDNVRCPTLVIRGETSDLLSRETLAEMQRRGPKPMTAEIKGVGHAPTLMLANEIRIVRDFLLSS
ncbi:MAG: alpha/beta fold hydrolase [Burkholderiaceae bacterium]